jgi:hypothetical protein
MVGPYPDYCVGPLVGGDNTNGSADQGRVGAERHECLAWIDAQPEGSIMFLYFWSRGTHPSDQLRKIVAGRDSSGH